jgi:hypothetical protein
MCVSTIYHLSHGISESAMDGVRDLVEDTEEFWIPVESVVEDEISDDFIPQFRGQTPRLGIFHLALKQLALYTKNQYNV